LEHDAAVREKVRYYFGPDVFNPEGSVDRKRLGSMVFKDGELLKVLNSILHPPIISASVRMMEEMRREGFPFVVIDAALLLEVDLPFQVDFTIALRCSREERVRRLLEKGGITEEEIRMRLKSQANLEDAFGKADVVIDTDGELSSVLEKVDAIVDEVLEGANEA
jgi:dephospho-CoA kinase